MACKMRRQITNYSYLTTPLLILLLSFGCGDSGGNGQFESDKSSNASDRDSVTIVLTGKDSISVFDLLISSHVVDFKSSMMGNFVMAIDSVRNSSSGYWTYAVNDSFPKVASDRYLTSDSDVIVWHLRLVK